MLRRPRGILHLFPTTSQQPAAQPDDSCLHLGVKSSHPPHVQLIANVRLVVVPVIVLVALC